jgi:hypothetical protein
MTLYLHTYMNPPGSEYSRALRKVLRPGRRRIYAAFPHSA